ncbi:hypothetical protein CEXT_484251 [Caerostris extrusa]|uniref:Uncharacterized protein n=1 Tax=Caerostris extrusa TaxID=172846 RepID=A0AAV4MJR1_CAEEX|nr:hypothetical protein CEXT_484251 [Caerostris extrusa]
MRWIFPPTGTDLLRTNVKYSRRLQWTLINKLKRLKSHPAEMCRQVSTAFKEMDVIDTIIAQSQRSDLPQDYAQMNENLLKKRQYLVEWVSRFKCPITNCPVHYLESKASKISDDNSNAKKLNVTKPKTKRNGSEISHSAMTLGSLKLLIKTNSKI